MRNERIWRQIQSVSERSLWKQTAWVQIDSALNTRVTLSVTTPPVVYVFAKWGQWLYLPHRAEDSTW